LVYERTYDPKEYDLPDTRSPSTQLLDLLIRDYAEGSSCNRLANNRKSKRAYFAKLFLVWAAVAFVIGLVPHYVHLNGSTSMTEKKPAPPPPPPPPMEFLKESRNAPRPVSPPPPPPPAEK
jgi:hypothetical protein